MSSSSWPYKSEMYLQGGRFKLCQFFLVVWRAGPISGLCFAQACEGGSSCPCGHALKQHNPIWNSVGQLLSFMKNLWFHSSSTKNGTLGPVLIWFFEKKFMFWFCFQATLLCTCSFMAQNPRFSKNVGICQTTSLWQFPSWGAFFLFRLHENSIWQYFWVMRWNASKPKIIWFMTKEFIVLFLMKCSFFLLRN